jgi:hypothetical protein
MQSSSESRSALRSPALEIVRPLTVKFSSERSELTFAVRNWSQALGSGERMSAPVIAARDLLVFLAAGASVGYRRMVRRRLTAAYPGLQTRTFAGMRWSRRNQAFHDVSHQTEIKYE